MASHDGFDAPIVVADDGMMLSFASVSSLTTTDRRRSMMAAATNHETTTNDTRTNTHGNNNHNNHHHHHRHPNREASSGGSAQPPQHQLSGNSSNSNNKSTTPPLPSAFSAAAVAEASLRRASTRRRTHRTDDHHTKTLPCRRRPDPPLAPRSHRAAAVFYGECHRAGISSHEAERAIDNAKGRHRRWWVEATKQPDHEDETKKDAGDAPKEDTNNTTSTTRTKTRAARLVPASVDKAGKETQSWSNRRSNGRGTGSISGRKRGRDEQGVLASHTTTTNDATAATVAATKSSDALAMERTKDFIKRVARRQEEQGGGYIFPRFPLSSGLYSDASEVLSDMDDDDDNADPDSAMISIQIDGDRVPLHLPSLTPVSASLHTSQQRTANATTATTRQINVAKSRLLTALADTGGDVTGPMARDALRILREIYQASGRDARSQRSVLDGTWLALSQPAYHGCLGRNWHNHYLYTLGRMSFDMFRPTELRCSLQANFSSIRIVEGPQGMPSHVPRRLRAQVQQCESHFVDGGTATGHAALRTYTIWVAFVIEANQTTAGASVKRPTHGESEADQKSNNDKDNNETSLIHRPIRGIMKNHGYMLPDPKVPNRLSIWFTEGKLEVNDEDASDIVDWKRIFADAPHRGMVQRANVLAARLLLGASVPDTMDEDGTMSYELRRPIGGHGMVYCDVLYLDEDVRVLQGHSGQVYVCARLGTDEEDGATATTATTTTTTTTTITAEEASR